MRHDARDAWQVDRDMEAVSNISARPVTCPSRAGMGDDMAKWPRRTSASSSSSNELSEQQRSTQLHNETNISVRNGRNRRDSSDRSRGGPHGSPDFTTRRPVARSLGLIYLTSLTGDF